MKIDLAAAARVVPLTTLIPGACVSQSAYEQQGQQLQAARAQAANAPDGRAKNRRIEIVLEGPGV
jgi:hypothetical protein